MIHPLNDFNAITPFLPLLGHAEFSLYDSHNPEHIQWLNTRIERFLFCGAQYFGTYDEQGAPLGVIAVIVEPRPAEVCNGWQSAEIVQLSVSTQRQRQGIGSQLLRCVEQWVSPQRVYCLYLSTYPADFDVVAFYGKNGYLPSGCLPDVYGPGLEGKLFLRKVITK